MASKVVEIAGQHVTIKNYKEPLKDIPKKVGFGYYGTLLGSIDGETVQCHICGKMYGELQAHVRQTHRISADKYREKFDLTYQTSLISEAVRERRKNNMLLTLSKLTSDQKAYMKKMSLKGIKERVKNRKQPKIRLETKNKRGTCPDQLLAKIMEVKEQIGGVPSLKDFIKATGGQRYKHLIFATFGSWNQALKMLKMKPKKNSGNKFNHGTYRKYTSDELLEYLANFVREHKKVPRKSDCKRGLLPSMESFARRFGTFMEAKRQAGIADDWGYRKFNLKKL